MEIGVEISLYPFNAEYLPPIRGFIERKHEQILERHHFSSSPDSG